MLISPIGLFAKIILASHRLKYTMFSNIFACCGDILSLDRIYPNAKMASIGHQNVSSNCPELGGPVDFRNILHTGIKDIAHNGSFHHFVFMISFLCVYFLVLHMEKSYGMFDKYQVRVQRLNLVD